jgi:hypothetical protein
MLHFLAAPPPWVVLAAIVFAVIGLGYLTYVAFVDPRCLTGGATAAQRCDAGKTQGYQG